MIERVRLTGFTDYTYAGIKDLAERLRRPAKTLIALSAQNDPFYIIPARVAAAEWFAEQWRRLKLEGEVHIRRVHYLLVSQKRAVLKPNGMPYEKLTRCRSAKRMLAGSSLATTACKGMSSLTHQSN
jgi:hypothetical protein